MPQIEAKEFARPAYRSLPHGVVDKCVNFYLSNDAGEVSLVSFHGLVTRGTVTNNAACRGAIGCGTGELYSVHGTKIYRHNTSTFANVELTATLNTSSGRVYMADNPTQVLLTDGTDGWIITKSSHAVAQVVDANFPASPTNVTFKDGRFIVGTSSPTTNVGRFSISALNDGTNWTPASYATAESDADPLSGVIAVGDNLYLIGKKRTEIWFNTGNSSFTYEKQSGAVIDVGTENFATVAIFQNTIFLYGNGGAGSNHIYAISGNTATPLTEGYESIYTLLTSNTTPFAFVYNYDGNTFYQITQASSTTYVYNLTTKSWSNRNSASLSHNRISAVVSGYGSNAIAAYMFDTENGKYYTPSNTQSNEGADAVDRIRHMGPFRVNGNRVSHKILQFDLIADCDADPTTVTMSGSYSDDGGFSSTNFDSASATITGGSALKLVRLTVARLGSFQAERWYSLTFSGAARLIIRNPRITYEVSKF